jgi:hypothetical protein
VSFLNSWPNFKLFRPKKSENRTKIGEVTDLFSFHNFFNLPDLEIYGAALLIHAENNLNFSNFLFWEKAGLNTTFTFTSLNEIKVNFKKCSIKNEM